MTENTTQPDPDTEPTGNLESTTITHPTPTQDPAESVVSKDDDDDDDDESTVPDLDEDDDDAGSSPDALAGAADGDDGHGS